MEKLIIILPTVGILFLIILGMLAPLMAPPAFLATLPFIALAIYLYKKKNSLKKELEEMRLSYRQKKIEIEKEIIKKDKRQSEQFNELKKFGRDLSGALNKGELLRLIANTFQKLTVSKSGESQCFLLSNDLGSDEFIYEVGDNFDSNILKSLRFKTTDEIIQSVVTSKKVHTFISDIFSGDSNITYFFKSEHLATLAQLDSMALIPLILEDEVWGIIVIFCHEDAAENIKKEEEFFELLMAQASIALGSAIHRGLASVDRLTQLYNRTFLQKRMNEEIEFCNRQFLPMSLMMLDIDHFKEINDLYGHQEGDMVLKKIAHIISKNVRLTDLVARYGGEEFVVVLPGIAETTFGKFSIAKRLCESIAKEDFIISEEKKIKVTVSIGVALRRYPDDKAQGMQELIKKADTLLYKAKNSGRNQVCYSAD
ncbi:MAG: sensor domain-containing diguanylate cyclase [Candidatus Omnitrophota bacterium]